jgi:hypothetical protein
MLWLVEDAFLEAVRNAFAVLTRDQGFSVVAEDRHHARFESETVGIDVWHDPRGEIDVNVSPLGTTDRLATWTYTGMVGAASVARLLEIAVEQMSANPAILGADQTFYEQLATENRRASKAWTAYYSGKGPQPTGELPP